MLLTVSSTSQRLLSKMSLSSSGDSNFYGDTKKTWSVRKGPQFQEICLMHDLRSLVTLEVLVITLVGLDFGE